MASAAEIVRRSSHHTLTIQHRSYDVRVTEVACVFFCCCVVFFIHLRCSCHSWLASESFVTVMDWTGAEAQQVYELVHALNRS